MQKLSRDSFTRFIKRYLVSEIIFVSIILVAVGGLLWYISAISTSESTRTAPLTSKTLEPTNNRIAPSTPDTPVQNVPQTHDIPSSINVVVNKRHEIQPATYIPDDLVDVGDGFMLSAKAATSFNAMMAAASSADEPLALTSSYRSYDTQVVTYAYWVNLSGTVTADTYSARPGYSEHQTGLAFDVADAAKKYVLSDFAQTSQYTWLQAHAAEYGFIQRYYAGYESITGYEAEAWHYRYIGTVVAKDMKVKNIKTLEQYWDVSGGDYQ